jgi:hypothetical protein
MSSVDRAVLEAAKLLALTEGVAIGPSVLAQLGGHESLTVHEYATTGGITLELPQDVLVNAPFDTPRAEASPLRLEVEGDGLALRADGWTIPVQAVLPLPGYLGARDAAGDHVRETAMSHADRIRVSPIVGCAYDCRFCDLARVGYRQRPIDQILRAIDVALADRALPPRHLLISGGSPPIRHAAGQDYFVETCLRITDHVRGVRTPAGDPFEIDIMMSARPDGAEFVETMVAAGVTGFSLNVEVFSPAAARRHLPLKHKWSREHLQAMIVRAAELLGRSEGRVRSLIIPGLESPEETLEGVEWLASLGCSPVLSPFRPAPDTMLEHADPVSVADLRRVLDGTRAIVREHGVLLGPRCVPCQHNTLSFPWDVQREPAIL